MAVTTGSLIYTLCKQQSHLRLTQATHVKDNEEYKVKTIQYNKNPEQPPGCSARKEEGEATPRMVKQEFEFFPDAAVPGHEERSTPNDKTKHAREAGIPNDNEEAPK